MHGGASPEESPQLHMYGLTRVRNGASCRGAVSGCAQLVRVAPSTGALSNVGHGHTPLAGVDDLRVVVGGVYYMLGDGWNGTGTVLLGISLVDGREVCRRAAPELAEVGLVGGGQSLNYDSHNDRLLLTGLNSSGVHPVGPGEYTHLLMSAPLPGCGPFTVLGQFGDADYEPMAHGTALDVAGQRLFITLSTGAHTYGMGVLDVRTSLLRVVPMAGAAALWGPTWHPPTNTLVGPGVGGGVGIEWRTLDPVGGRVTSRPLRYATTDNVTFPGLLGNLGSVRAYDSGADVLYTLAGRGDPSNPTTELVSIDARTGTLLAHAPLHGDVGWSGSILSQIALAPNPQQ